MSWRHSDKAKHDWLVLVPANAPYVRFISDLAGFDPVKYDGTPATLVPGVMAWLATRPGGLADVTPLKVIERLETFRTEKAKLKTTWSGAVPWPRLVKAATAGAAEV